ncbi:MAG: flagellar export chaperone FliS [Candidatus Krumholzibacteriia bacterium]
MYDPRSIRRYQEADVGSMSREKMITLLYEKMIGCFQQADAALGRDDRITMVQRVNLALRIVTELRNALDHAVGGEISRNLESLYDFVFHQSLQVLVDRDPAHLRNCVRVLSPLLEAWRQIPPGTADRTARETVSRSPGADPAPARAGDARESVRADDAGRPGGPDGDHRRLEAGLLSVSA